MAAPTGYNTSNVMEQGGSQWDIAGTLLVNSGGVVTVESGGAVNVASGGALKIAGTDITAAAAALANNTSGAGYPVLSQEVTFTQTTGNGTYTGTIALPAGAVIQDVQVHGIALWNAGTSASLVVGDANSANGFFLATNLNATDLLAGEANTIQHPGGLAGAYIAAEQRVLYSSTARNVIGVVTQVGTGTLGRTRLVVTYTVNTPGAATKV